MLEPVRNPLPDLLSSVLLLMVPSSPSQIWLPDLEVQAAKRAHRLGQTKPVDLQVLVIEGSYEDALLKRRGQLAQAGALHPSSSPSIQTSLLPLCRFRED